jgi:succinyl-CoA:mesaconate CoA transferase
VGWVDASRYLSAGIAAVASQRPTETDTPGDYPDIRLLPPDKVEHNNWVVPFTAGHMSALSGLRVLDLTRVLGGPYCTMLLSDLGADVVKIEPPGGDLVRSTPPFAEHDGEPYGGYFQSVNRGKRSLELDLRTDRDRERFLDLAGEADVLVENFRAGTMERLGLAYERLREENPELIYSSIRGFGDPRTGETDRQDRPAYDLVVQALAGVMEVNGQPDSPPTKVGLGVGDIFTGVLNAVGILAALHHRDASGGGGQYVDTAMYDSMVSLCERTVYQYSYDGKVPTRRGNAHPTLFPYDAFRAADGLVVIAALGDSQWRALCEAMDRPDLAANYPDDASRLADRKLLRAIIADWVGSRSTAAVLDALDSEVPCAPVQDVTDVFEDEGLRRRGMLVEVDQPGTDRTVEIAGTPIKMTRTPTGPDRRAPLLDEHADETFAERGTPDPARREAGDAAATGETTGTDSVGAGETGGAND